MHVYACVCMFIYIYMYVCVCIYIYIYIYMYITLSDLAHCIRPTNTDVNFRLHAHVSATHVHLFDTHRYIHIYVYTHIKTVRDPGTVTEIGGIVREKETGEQTGEGTGKRGASARGSAQGIATGTGGIEGSVKEMATRGRALFRRGKRRRTRTGMPPLLLLAKAEMPRQTLSSLSKLVASMWAISPKQHHPSQTCSCASSSTRLCMLPTSHPAQAAA